MPDRHGDAHGSEHELPDPLPPGYRLHDRYLIDRELPRQGMGRVYKASHISLDQPVAINVLSRDLRNQDGVRRFRACFRNAFHRHRGRVYEYGEWGGASYVVVEYVEGLGATVDVSEA